MCDGYTSTGERAQRIAIYVEEQSLCAERERERFGHPHQVLLILRVESTIHRLEVQVVVRQR